MQLFVHDPLTMVAAPVEGDVDGIAKRSHYLLLKRAGAVAHQLHRYAFT
jgi:hypothetical protein